MKPLREYDPADQTANRWKTSERIQWELDTMRALSPDYKPRNAKRGSRLQYEERIVCGLLIIAALVLVWSILTSLP